MLKNTKHIIKFKYSKKLNLNIGAAEAPTFTNSSQSVH
jgi:hypothetical protein